MKEGEYDLIALKNGYIPCIIKGITIRKDETTIVDDIVLVRNQKDADNILIAGRVNHGIEKTGIPFAKIVIRKGWNNKDGDCVFDRFGVSSFYTGYNGEFAIPVAKGNYTIEISKDGFTTIYENVTTLESEYSMPESYSCFEIYPLNKTSDGKLLQVSTARGYVSRDNTDFKELNCILMDVTDANDEVIGELISKTRLNGIPNRVSYPSKNEYTVACLYEDGNLTGIYKFSAIEAKVFWAYMLNGEMESEETLKEEKAPDGYELEEVLEPEPENQTIEENEEDELVLDEAITEELDEQPKEGFSIDDAA